MNPADPFGLIGQVLDGQFRVDQFVGEGGFSIVYRGHHAGLNEPIAIKCLKLPPALGSALVESFIRRFRDESRIHYRLSQGNLSIARSIASGTTMSSSTSALVPYMVLEWLDGRSLAQDFDVRRQQGQTGRSLDEVIKLLDTAAQALAFAHAQGVVHRDMNPGNLFLAGRPPNVTTKVLDFGVAKVISDHALELGPRAHTLGQIRIFAPAYGSPEQFDDSVGKVGPASDVYSFSLIVLEALRDLPVRDGEHLGEFALKALEPTGRPTPRSLGVPVGDAVEDLFRRAGALRPEERPIDMGQFWGGLKHAMRVDAESGKPPHADAAPSRPGWKPQPPAAGAPPERPVTAEIPSMPAVEVLRPGATAPAPPQFGDAHRPADGGRPQPLQGTMRLQGPPPPIGASGGAAALGATPLTSTLVMDSRIHVAVPQVPPVQPAPAPPPQNPLNATMAMASPYAHSQNVAPFRPPPAVSPAPPAATMVMDASNPSLAAARARADAAANQGSGSFAAAYPMVDPLATVPSALPRRADVPTEVPPAPQSAGKIIAIVALTVILLGAIGGVVFWRVTASGPAPAPSAAASDSAPKPPPAASAPVAAGAAASAPAPTAEELPAATVPTATAAPEETAAAPPPAPAAEAPAEPAPRHGSASGSSNNAGNGGASPSSGSGSNGSSRGAPTSGGSTAPAATPATTPGGFDPKAARAGLDVMNGILASCRSKTATAKTGDGKINVTFNPDGRVDRASVDDPPFAGTPEGACAAGLFKRTKIAPFNGSPSTIAYTFHIPK